MRESEYLPNPEDFTLTSDLDGLALQCYAWKPDSPPKAVVVIAHGLGEHARRYSRFATALNRSGFSVTAIDHRGHGATGSPDNLGNFLSPGWEGLVADLGQLVAESRHRHPNLPLFLFGHSMGSFAAQHFVLDHSHVIDGLVLSGSAAMDKLIESILSAAASSEESSTFSPFNAPFEPARTDFDWLSRDEREVDAYIADPLCGFDLEEASNISMVSSAAVLAEPNSLAKVRGDLPVLLTAGDADPINNGLAFLEELERRYRACGIQDLDTQYYSGGRHEMLNETNREDVTRNIIDWLNTRL